jgi:hypothetical protein
MGGSPSGNQLIEITATEFLQNNATTESRDPANGGSLAGLGPLLYASGSYVANTLGMHTLTPSAGSTERFFTAMGQTLGASTAFTPAEMTFISDSFTVTAIPEPSALMLLAAALVPFGLARAHRWRKKAAHPEIISMDARGSSRVCWGADQILR